MSDSRDLFRFLRVKIQNLVQRGVVTISGERYQGTHLGGRVADDLEHFAPQGLHFRAPVGSEYLQLHPVAETANAVMVCAHDRSGLPSDTMAVGEGGLHYRGTFKVFVSADGKVHLGGGIAASDFVALAAKVKTEIERLATDMIDLKNATQTVATAVDVLAPGTGLGFFNSTSSLPHATQSVAAANVKAT